MHQPLQFCIPGYAMLAKIIRTYDLQMSAFDQAFDPLPGNEMKMLYIIDRQPSFLCNLDQCSGDGMLGSPFKRRGLGKNPVHFFLF